MISREPLPFAQAIEALQRRAPVPASVLSQMGELFEQARLVSFYVSHQEDEDKLASALQTLSDGMNEGKSYVDLREEIQGIFGETMGSEQAALIATQNIRLAYGAGRRMQQEQIKEDYPFVRYLHGARFEPESPRPEHEALDGKVFRLEDAWDLPNGFNCSCEWEPVAAEEVKEDEVMSAEKLFTEGYEELIGPGAAPFTPPQSGIERDAQGNFKRVNNSGTSLFGWRDALSPEEAQAEQITNLLPRNPAPQKPLPSPAERPASINPLQTPEKIAREIASANGLDPDKPNPITNPLGVPEVIGPNILNHLAEKNPEDARFEVLGGLRQAIEDPDEIHLLPYRNPSTGQVFLERAYIKNFQTGKKNRPLVFIARFQRGQWVDYTAMTAKDKTLNQFRSGALLYARP